jgi:hypothetical protein
MMRGASSFLPASLLNDQAGIVLARLSAGSRGIKIRTGNASGRKKGVSDMKTRVMVFGLTLATAVFITHASFGQTDDIQLIRSQLRAIKNAEAEVRIPALYKVKGIATASEHSQVKLAALDVLREPVKSSQDHVRIPAVYAITDIASSTQDVDVQRNALSALKEPIKAGTIAIRLVAIDAVNIITTHSNNRNELQLTALTLLNEPVDSHNDSVRMPAVNSIIRLVEGSGNEAAYQQALNSLRQPIASSRKEIRFMTIDAVERIGLEAKSKQTKQKAIDALEAPKKSDWSDALVERAYEATFKIRESMTAKVT